MKTDRGGWKVGRRLGPSERDQRKAARRVSLKRPIETSQRPPRPEEGEPAPTDDEQA